MNKPLWIIANWKSNETIQEALEWISNVGPALPHLETLKIAVCPTASALEEVKKNVKTGNFPLLVGTQDLSPFTEGAYTGEEAASILKQFVDIAIIGHSERRKYFQETDAIVTEKVVRANEQAIIPIVCVQDENTPIPENCQIIAYEPIFAIGTGTPDTPENANAVAEKIKQKYADRPDLLILYGGSVNKDNAKSFVSQEAINGLLIGKSSLSSDEFIAIINACVD